MTRIGFGLGVHLVPRDSIGPASAIVKGGYDKLHGRFLSRKRCSLYRTTGRGRSASTGLSASRQSSGM